MSAGGMSAGVAERRLVPTELAALAAGVKPETIRKWASRGKLTRYGRPGRAEYDLAELLTVLGGVAAAIK
ncbi:transcriptional regulator [Nocardia sp. NPDC088792]|uniref:transcriptional regulator n=1 Tax=Nocardia sp. NPDC088792 TaxID=3364332 RepID=UPI0037F44FF2